LDNRGRGVASAFALVDSLALDRAGQRSRQGVAGAAEAADLGYKDALFGRRCAGVGSAECGTDKGQRDKRDSGSVQQIILLVTSACRRKVDQEICAAAGMGAEVMVHETFRSLQQCRRTWNVTGSGPRVIRRHSVNGFSLAVTLRSFARISNCGGVARFR
jgi:hypothetical protein